MKMIVSNVMCSLYKLWSVAGGSDSWINKHYNRLTIFANVFFFSFHFFLLLLLVFSTFCWYNFLHVISFISLSLCFFSSFFLFLSLSLVFLYSVYPSFSVFSAPSLPFSLLRLPSSFPALFYPFSLPTPLHNFLMDFSFSLQFRRNCYFMKIFT